MADKPKDQKPDNDVPENDPQFMGVVHHFLATPPKPHVARAKLPAHEYFVIGDRIRVAVVCARDATTGSITADLYRNLDDLRAGAVMERGVYVAG